MQLTNTSKRPDFQVVALTMFAFQDLDIDKDGLLVKVKNTTKAAYRGSTYHGVPRMSPARRDPSVKQLVTIGIGTDDRYPTDNTSKIAKKIGTLVFDSLVEYKRNLREGRIPSGDGYSHTYTEHMNDTVTVYVFNEHRVPYGGKNSPIIEVKDWQEGLLSTAAHEAFHVYQTQRQLLGYYCPMSESEAEWYAYERLRDWRKNLEKLGLERI